MKVCMAAFIKCNTRSEMSSDVLQFKMAVMSGPSLWKLPFDFDYGVQLALGCYYTVIKKITLQRRNFHVSLAAA